MVPDSGWGDVGRSPDGDGVRRRGRVTSGRLRDVGLVAALALAATGCVTTPDDSIPEFDGELATFETSGGLARVDVALEHDKIVQGENVLRVELAPIDSSARAELVDVSAFMPAHGHGTSIPVVVRDGDHYRVSELMLFMPGRWEVTFDVLISGEADDVLFTVDVE